MADESDRSARIRASVGSFPHLSSGVDYADLKEKYCEMDMKPLRDELDRLRSERAELLVVLRELWDKCPFHVMGDDAEVKIRAILARA